MNKSLWAANFSSNVGGIGTGIVTIDDSFISGGDASHYYVGKYSLNEQNISSTITVNKYSAGQSIFGTLDSFRIELKGTFDPNNMLLAGSIIENPQLTITINLKKLQDLD